MNGFIHSIESFGAVDGPGIRLVVFMQGCTLRCAYCHNPDTWQIGVGRQMSPSQIIEQYQRNRQFYKNGGITVSGGEPLLQIDFLTKLFSCAKQKNIHTCIDTSGAVFDPSNTKEFDKLIQYTDLVLLDIKHINNKKHIDITGKGNSNILDFARYLDRNNVDVWIRHVVVPDLTDSESDLAELGRFIATLKNVKALDVIPYHTYGVEKYAELGIKYRLENVPNVQSNLVARAKSIIINEILAKK